MSAETGPDGDSPHILSAESETGGERSDGEASYRAFWADVVADEVEARDPEEPIVIKGGVSPSGVAHLGNFNEIMRGYFVAEVLRERGHEVRQVFTSDDKDPLRKVPRSWRTPTARSLDSVRSTRARSAGISGSRTRRFRTRSANASRTPPTLPPC